MTMTNAITRCPFCGRENQAHSGAPGTTPKDGDAALCWGCLSVGIFTYVNGSLAIRVPTAAEQKEIDARDDVRRARAAIRESYTPREAAALTFGAERGGSCLD